MKRREFLKNAMILSAAASCWRPVSVQAEAVTAWKTKLQKALICGYPTEDILSQWKRHSFDGAEATDWACGPEKAEEARKVAEKLGMRIHSVLYGWANVNNPDSFEKDIENVTLALNTTKGYGADALLLVPCRTGGKMPKPREFKIDFDPETLMVSKVVDGDNAPYKEYIEAQNVATKATIEMMKRLIPVAEKTGVVIALENVWNNLWVTPDFYAALVKYFKNPWVKAYFDIGNHVKYAKPEEYLYALNKEIVKLHVKDFKLDMNHPDMGGFGGFVEIRSGSVNWPSVRKAIDDIGYSGYMTIEGGSDPIAKKSADLDLIIAGK
ncbi:MAG: sugar phosphate isomerase/epimerase family protein [Planctomycetia bacterium]|nr:sugar phosphate isomerase/epimerase family protein [Planctomycetia bacterium]